MSWSHRVFLVCSVLTAFAIQKSEQGEHEVRLYRDMLANYEPLSRPVANESEAVVVTIGITLQQIVDVDEKNQIIHLNVWLTYSWKDYSFQWEPKDYGGVTEIRLPPSKIWKPDVLLYNSADDSFDSTYPSNVVVRQDGSMEWIPPGIIKSTCKIDITWFPFDDQHCDLKFGSWTFSGSMLDLRAGEVNNSTYTSNGEWDIISVTPIRNQFKYDCCPDPYYDVTFKMWIRRRVLYYVFNMIIPCLLISFMTLLDFTLPPESGEKLSLVVTIFMSLCVFLLMVAEALPPTSDAVPLIGTYFSSVMIIVSVSLVFTVIVLNVHHRHPVTHDMGPWAKNIFLNWLPWLLLMERPGYVSRRGRLIKEDELAEREMIKYPSMVTSSASKSLLANIIDMEEPNPSILAGIVNNTFSSIPNSMNENVGVSDLKIFHRSLDFSAPKDTKDTDAANALRYAIITHLEPVLQAIHTELKIITKKIQDDDEENEVVNDWKFAAMVVDRLSLFGFTVLMLISTCAILFAAPHF